MELFEHAFQVLPAIFGTSALSEEIEIAIVTFLGVTILLMSVGGSIIIAAAFSGKTLKAVQSGLGSAGKRFGNLLGGIGKQAAKESKYGQAYQMYRGRQKAATSERARGLIRGKRILGGGLEAQRITEAEERKHRQEKEANLGRSITSPLGKLISQGVNLNDVRTDSSGSFYRVKDSTNDSDINTGYRDIRLTDTDTAALSRLKQQGYVDSRGNFSNDHSLTNAALQSMMAVEDITNDDLEGIAKRTGTSATENAYISENLKTAAAQHNLSNMKYADISGGKLNSYLLRGQTAPNSLDGSASASGAIKMVAEGGLAGANKDVYKDPVVKSAISSYISGMSTDAEKKQAALKVITDSSHLTGSGVIEKLRDAVRTGVGESNLSNEDFNAAFNSLKSNGAVPLPAVFGGSSPTATPAPSPPAAPTPPPVEPYDPTKQRKPPPPGTDNYKQGPGGLFTPPGV